MLAEEDDADDVEATCRVLLVEGAAEESSWDEPNDRSRGSPVPLTEITSFQTKKNLHTSNRSAQYGRSTK